jgi:sortase A
MITTRAKRFLSYLLVAGGAFLLYLGARDLLDWHLGQAAAEKQFEASFHSPPVESSPQSPAEHSPEPSAESIPASPSTPATAALPRVRVPVEPGGTLAKLIIPRLDTQLYVVEGDGPKELRRGPGHLTGSAMPGDEGNCVIAGHRDTHFRVLKDIRQGDDIVLQTKSGQYLYRVRSIKVVSPDYTEPLKPTRDAELNLITCYPFFYVGSAPKRFVVEARLAGIVARAS